jgi:hypothetical protein
MKEKSWQPFVLELVRLILAALAGFFGGKGA